MTKACAEILRCKSGNRSQEIYVHGTQHVLYYNVVGCLVQSTTETTSERVVVFVIAHVHRHIRRP